MRDQNLVFRAERAATALEEAWTRWRERHSPGTGPMPPVSSYVGYSVDEPWGQPRVVFGIEAGEAERLAAILDRYDFAGPVEAEVSAQPERRRADYAPPAWTVPGGLPAVPAQAAQPDREHTRPPQPGPSAWAGPAQTAAEAARPLPRAPIVYEPPLEPLPPVPHDRPAPPPDSKPRAAVRPAAPADAHAKDATPEPADAHAKDATPEAAVAHAKDATPEPADAHAKDATPEPADAGAADLNAEQPIVPPEVAQAAAVADLPAELPDNEAAYLQELAARTVARPGIVSLRPHPAGVSETAESPAPVPGRAPRKTARDPDQAAGLGSPLQDAAPAVTGDGVPEGSDLPVARLRSVSRLNRSRKPADKAQQTAADEPKPMPTDTAV